MDLEGRSDDMDGMQSDEMTPEEKAEAKRKYKNRRGRERWQRRRKEQKVREREILTAASSDGAATSSRIADGPTGTAAEPSTKALVSPRSPSLDSNAEANMLREFCQLGKVDESKLKQRLNQLWSFSFLPNGTELFRQDIHELVSDIVDLTRGGAMDNKDYCQALAASEQKIHSQTFWAESPKGLKKIVQVFLEGREAETLVNFDNIDFLRDKSITLKQLSELSQVVLVHLYCHLAQQVFDLIPSIQTGIISPEIHQKATSICLDLALLVSSFLTGNLSTFATNRVENKHYEFSQALLANVVSCLDITPSQSLRLWHLWDTSLDELNFLLAEKLALEEHLTVTITRAQRTEAAYLEACEHMQALKANQLALCLHGLLLDTKVVYEILSPCQSAFLLCSQLSPGGPAEILSNKLDPVGRMTVLFQRSLFPNSPSRGVI